MVTSNLQERTPPTRAKATCGQPSRATATKHWIGIKAKGRTWDRIAPKGGDCFGATVHPRQPDRVFLCINEGGEGPGLWLSRDAGKTWKSLDGMRFRNAQRVTFDPRDDSII